MYTFGWIGVNDTPGHDKLWGWFKNASGDVYTFWGPRSLKWIKFKRMDSEFEAMTKAAQKNQTGYRQYSQDSMNKHMAPGFSDRFESAFVMEKFSGKIRTDS